MAEIVSGVLGEPDLVRDYRVEWLGDILIERAIWGELTEPRTLYGTVIADTDYIWYRFWLPAFQQIVERFYSADGAPVATKIDVCSPLTCGHSGCCAVDYLLDIWIDLEGRVTVRNEERFEEALRREELAEDEAERAERHLRDLTAAIARGRFPPAIVRNWQVDPRRVNADAPGQSHAVADKEDAG